MDIVLDFFVARGLAAAEPSAGHFLDLDVVLTLGANEPVGGAPAAQKTVECTELPVYLAQRHKLAEAAMPDRQTPIEWHVALI